MKARRVFAAAVVVALAFVMVPAHAAPGTATYKVTGALSVTPATCDFPCVPFGTTYKGSGALARWETTRLVRAPGPPDKGTWSFSGRSPTKGIGFGTGSMTINWVGGGTSIVLFPAIVYPQKGFAGVGRVSSGLGRNSLVLWVMVPYAHAYYANFPWGGHGW